MKWKGRRQSGNVLDQRKSKKAGGIGIVGLVVGAGFIYMMGGNPLPFLLQNAGSIGGAKQVSVESEERDDQLKNFASVVLADTEDVWQKIFREVNLTYQEPKMVLFRGQVQSACGSASSAMGPFYCPGNSQVYLDLSFFDQLERQLGAKGDFAQAYVIAHEVGHHVQNLIGVNKLVRQKQRSMGTTQKNQISVVVELQADCFSGLWAKETQKAKAVLEPGDLEEALNAASAIGDDKLQTQSRGQVTPDSFTHGTSAQRHTAFKTGFDSGLFKTCLERYNVN